MNGLPRILLACLVLAMATGCSALDPRTIIHDDTERTYWIYAPDGAKGSQERPLVIALHGGGGEARRFARAFDLRPAADAEPFLLVYPQGIDNGWNDGRIFSGKGSDRTDIDDVGFLDAVIDDVSQEFAVDASRIYMTGVSNGAMMTHRYAHDRSSRIAAAAAVIGNVSEALAAMGPPAGPVPMLIMNGTDDPLVPYDGGDVEVGRQRRGAVLSTDASAAFWAAANGCEANGEPELLPDRDPSDGATLTRTAYTGCGSPVVVYSVIGGGHTWPGGPQYAPAMIIGPATNDADGLDIITEFLLGEIRTP